MGAYLNRPRIFLRRRPIAVASIYNADMSEARRLHRETKDEGLASSAKELSSESPGWGTRQMADMISSAVSSVLFHATLILLLSAVLIVTHGRRIPTVMTVTLEEIPELGEFLEIVEMIVPEKPLPAALVNAAPLDVRAEPKVEPPDQSDSADDRAEGPVVATVSLQTAPAEPVWTRDPLGGGLAGRGGRTKAQLARERGGTARSEEAVTQGIKWLAEHQHPGGYWTFDHRDGPCERRCGNPGSVTTRTGATALALLPFLGAGHTHIEGPYRDVVRKGLNFLSQQQIVSSRGGDLQDGTMYGHGLATIALCEAVAMTGDDRFRLDAQRAVDYIAYAQHSAGGWRYLPRQPGDTTVFGWQFMALKSGQLAGLEVGNRTIASATRFLDRVQSGDGAYCGYLADGQEPTPTAIGLLARMYSG